MVEFDVGFCLYPADKNLEFQLECFRRRRGNIMGHVIDSAVLGGNSVSTQKLIYDD